jgi:hypothetical protein
LWLLAVRLVLVAWAVVVVQVAYLLLPSITELAQRFQ